MRLSRSTRCAAWLSVPLLLLCVCAQGFARTGEERRAGGSLVALDDGWKYRWGDSPRDADGLPAWVSEPSGDWTVIGLRRDKAKK